MDNIVNLDRYPLGSTGGSAYAEVRDEAIASLKANGAAVFDGFLCAGQADAAVHEISGQLANVSGAKLPSNWRLTSVSPG